MSKRGIDNILNDVIDGEIQRTQRNNNGGFSFDLLEASGYSDDEVDEAKPEIVETMRFQIDEETRGNIDETIKEVESAINSFDQVIEHHEKQDHIHLQLITKYDKDVVNINKFNGNEVDDLDMTRKQKIKNVTGATVAGSIVAGSIYAVGFVPVMVTATVGGSLYFIGKTAKDLYYGKDQ